MEYYIDSNCFLHKSKPKEYEVKPALLAISPPKRLRAKRQKLIPVPDKPKQVWFKKDIDFGNFPPRSLQTIWVDRKKRVKAIMASGGITQSLLFDKAEWTEYKADGFVENWERYLL